MAGVDSVVHIYNVHAIQNTFQQHRPTSHCYSLLDVIACATLDAGFLPRKLEIKLPASSSFVKSTPYTTKKTLTSNMTRDSTVDILHVKVNPQ